MKTTNQKDDILLYSILIAVFGVAMYWLTSLYGFGFSKNEGISAVVTQWISRNFNIFIWFCVSPFMVTSLLRKRWGELVGSVIGSAIVTAYYYYKPLWN